MFPKSNVILREKYGKSNWQLQYSKPIAQDCIKVREMKMTDNVRNFIKAIFLPKGYPHSVSEDYINYQIWDTAQAFCSTISGILATQEVLRGVGVGDSTVTPLAATVTWVLKDGCGHLGRILFAYTHGNYLDVYSKTWRLYADALNDVAMTLEIILPSFGVFTPVVLCCSTVMKAIVGVAGGATRAAMTQHHSLLGNLADLSAKDSAQETAVNLIASFLALFLLSIFGDSKAIFGVMVFLHLLFNYYAVRAICLRTFNEPRLVLAIKQHFNHIAIIAPATINRMEPILFRKNQEYVLSGFKFRLGSSYMDVIQEYGSASFLRRMVSFFEGRPYILIPTRHRVVHVLFKENAVTLDYICGYFHCVLLVAMISYVTSDPSKMAFKTGIRKEKYVRYWETLNKLCPFDYRQGPTEVLISSVNSIFDQEWEWFRDRIISSGWNTNQHLLLVDEWRVCNNEYYY